MCIRDRYQDHVLNGQILLSDTLMLTPSLHEGQWTVWPYLPKDKWYNFIDGKRRSHFSDSPAYHETWSPLRQVLPVFMRGGTIVYNQSTEGVTRISQLDNKFSLIVALTDDQGDGRYVANGQIMTIYDYKNPRSVEKCQDYKNGGCLLDMHVSVSISSNTLDLDLKFSSDFNPVIEEILIQQIYVYGLSQEKLLNFPKRQGIYSPEASAKISGHREKDSFEKVKVEMKTFRDSDEAVGVFTFNEFTVENGRKVSLAYKAI
eukprot:TRINITY_DN257_c0_g2_i4.p1 TRINITY_DN257_c0_g2~~TRINITY_DN257_c0_g2_i4.p1  ORF type:complete len:260 (-),score=43.54 TRINITY_DN257_c0_g2_i4:43-822(-)